MWEGWGCTHRPLQEELRRFCLPNINLLCQFKACPLNTKCSLAWAGAIPQTSVCGLRHRALSLYYSTINLLATSQACNIETITMIEVLEIK